MKLFKKYTRITFLLMLTLASVCSANEFDTSAASTARSLGMGNAGINTQHGGSSIFYNPANIATKNTRASFEIFNLSTELNQGFISQTERGSVNIMDLQEYYTSLKGNTNNFAGGRISAYPNMTFRNLSLGLLYERNRGAMVRATDDALWVKARDRFGPTAALSFRMFGGVLRFGMMAQYLTVGNANTILVSPSTRTPLSWEKFIVSGAGISKTAGMTLTLPMRYLPSFSLVARDIGGTNYTLPALVSSGTGSGLTNPTLDNQYMTFDLGFSYVVYMASRMEMKFEGDYRDITSQYGQGPMSRVFAGTELSFFDVVHLRAGMMHGYPTAGFGIGTPKANLNLAWYSDELENRLRANRDQRFVLQYTSSFFGNQ